MEMIFSGGDEIVRLVIDRANHELKVSSAKTSYELMRVAWSNLFDKGKEREQFLLTEKMSDKVFIEQVRQGMEKVGYKLNSVKE